MSYDNPMFFFDKSAILPNLGTHYSIVISDVHLNEKNSELEQLFTDFLTSSAVCHAESLIILGNLFDVWIGDDELSNAWSIRMAKKLFSLSRLHVNISIMGGNHDFLLGKRFCAQAGAVSLEEPAVLSLYGVVTLLVHGDVLCTEDFEHQMFRKVVRQAIWQREFLSQTLEARRAIGKKLRDENIKRTRLKPNDYFNVSNQSVLKLLADTKAKRMIHGHVPHEGVHNHLFEGHVIQRWVLPRWQMVDNRLCGGALVVAQQNCFPLHFFLQHSSATVTL